MNWKVIVVALVLVVAGGLLFMVLGNKASVQENPLSTPENSDQSVASVESQKTFVCVEGKRIQAGFADNEQQVQLTLADGSSYTLERTPSTSGLLYANEDRQIVFWIRGDTATLEENGTQTHSDCMEEGETSHRGEKVVRGKVTAVNNDAAAADGPSLIMVAEASGEVTLAIATFGHNLCAAKDNIASGFDIKVGDTIEARGLANEEGQVVPCESSDHFFRKTTAQ